MAFQVASAVAGAPEMLALRFSAIAVTMLPIMNPVFGATPRKAGSIMEKAKGQTIYYRMDDPAAVQMIDTLCDLFRRK